MSSVQSGVQSFHSMILRKWWLQISFVCWEMDDSLPAWTIKIKLPHFRRCVGIQSEKALAPHSSTLAWKIPWMEEPGGLQSMGSLRVRHNWATSLSLFTFTHWRRKWQPTSVFLPGESQGQGSLVGCHLWVAQSRTRLKRLSSSSSSSYLMITSWWTGPVTVTHWQLVACGRAPLRHQSMAEQDH